MKKLSRLQRAESVQPMNNTSEKPLEEIFQQLLFSSVPMENPVNWDGDNYPMPTDMLGDGDSGDAYSMESETEDGIPTIQLPQNMALDLLMDSLAEDLMGWTAECDQCEEAASESEDPQDTQDPLDPNNLFPGIQYPMDMQLNPEINTIPSYFNSPMGM